MASAKATIDHDKIRDWVEARGGYPAHVKRTGSRRGDPGVLRIDYQGFSGEESLERIDWDQWFDWFDRDNLAFLYQNEKKSRFSKLVDRGSVKVEGRAPSPARKRASAKKSSSKKASSKKVSSKKATKSAGEGARRSTKTATKTATKKKAAAKKAPAKKASTKSAAAKRTTSHAQIQKWVEARGGYPARVKRTGSKKDPGVLRIDYPGYSGTKTLERIEWDEWFDWFDRDKLAFLYQDKRDSRFSKLVRR